MKISNTKFLRTKLMRIILFSTGWVMKLELDEDSGVDELMDVDAYEQHVKEAV